MSVSSPGIERSRAWVGDGEGAMWIYKAADASLPLYPSLALSVSLCLSVSFFLSLTHDIGNVVSL